MADESQPFTSINLLHDDSQAQAILQRFGFLDWKTARTNLLKIDGQDHNLFQSFFPFFIKTVGSAPDPDRSLLNLVRLSSSYGPALLTKLKENQRLLDTLVTLFSSSPFLTEILLQTPDALDLINNRQDLSERKTIERYQSEAMTSLQSFPLEEERLDSIRRYQRHQLLQIGICDFLGIYNLGRVFSQLSRLAVGLVRACLNLACQQTGIGAGGLAIVAMGKLGGWELNYSSDIDLLFVSRNDPIEYLNLVKHFIKNLTSNTQEGFLYRVDVRLRPWGNDGPLVTTLDSCVTYFQKHARLWEKLAFLKSRPIAGNLSLGEELKKLIEPFISNIPEEEVRAGIFAMKQRTEEFLREKGRYWGEVKLGEGSIRDIEFVVQSLEIIHPTIRTRATLKAIPRLQVAEFLTFEDARILIDGYNFMRTLEHYLQMIDYRQTHTLPSDPHALRLLAKRLGFEGPDAGLQFVDRYVSNSRAIRQVFLKYLGEANLPSGADASRDFLQLLEHVEHMNASYTEAFTAREIRHHTRLAKSLDISHTAFIEAEPLDATHWRVTIVGYDALGELSLICGLMFLYGLDIITCQAFTYERVYERGLLDKGRDKQEQSTRPKIVDVFIVQSTKNEPMTDQSWNGFRDGLLDLLIKLQSGRRRDAQGELVKMLAGRFQDATPTISPLYPIDIEIDNSTSELYTILRIGTVDTVGFLYEFTNALALNHISISRMSVQSIGEKVKDIFYVIDEAGEKITSPEKQQELRAAIVLIKHFTHLLPHSPDPEMALLHFREFVTKLFERPHWPNELISLEQPEVLDALAKLLGVSGFLWEDFLRMQYSNLLPVVSDMASLEIRLDRPELQKALDALMLQSDNWLSTLNGFKDREMFRIDMRHILGITKEIWDFSLELTDLAEVVISSAFDQCNSELLERHGSPLLEDRSPCKGALFALGKCGGRELGFASDIELMLVYSGEGETSGPDSISTFEYYEELIQSLANSIWAKKEGIFHIDLQLRPYGKAGSQAVSLEAFKRYFAPNGPAWSYERQALVKLRPIAGDPDLGEKVSSLRDDYIYTHRPFDVTAMRAMRERQIRHLVPAGTFNAKYSSGGMVDLEYLIQGLQISHGAEFPGIRTTNTRLAMVALKEAGIISVDDYSRLKKAHIFLSWLIESLRVVRGNSIDINIPRIESEEYVFLARRLRYGSDIKRLQEEMARYTKDVQEINRRLLPE